MKNSTKQVVVLNNLSSPHIEQAILFLKDAIPGTDDKILAEAEKIVADYFGQTQQNTAARQNQNWIPWLISGVSVLVSVTLFVLLCT